jgi:glycosyltransferase involved in cell wall biosynthesis
MGPKMNTSISAFFPVLNEEGTVRKLTCDLIKVLSSHFEDYEVIIVNDGSTDGTGQIVEELCRENHGHVKAIHHDKSQGYGNALRAGFAAAARDLVFYTDGDYQFDMNDLHEVLPAIEGYDLVVGYRRDRQDPKYRLMLSKGYNLLVHFLFGLHLKDIDCSFKLFKQSALKTITIDAEGYFIDTEIMVKAKKQGLKIKEIGVRHLPRTSGKSKVRLRHIFVTLQEIMVLWRKLKRNIHETEIGVEHEDFAD